MPVSLSAVVPSGHPFDTAPEKTAPTQGERKKIFFERMEPFGPAPSGAPQPPAVLHKLEAAGCHEDRSPPLPGLIRRGRTPPPSLGASACEELLPTTPTYKEAASLRQAQDGLLSGRIEACPEPVE